MISHSVAIGACILGSVGGFMLGWSCKSILVSHFQREERGE